MALPGRVSQRGGARGAGARGFPSPRGCPPPPPAPASERGSEGAQSARGKGARGPGDPFLIVSNSPDAHARDPGSAFPLQPGAPGAWPSRKGFPQACQLLGTGDGGGDPRRGALRLVERRSGLDAECAPPAAPWFYVLMACGNPVEISKVLSWEVFAGFTSFCPQGPRGSATFLFFFFSLLKE
jgi:hypothetical protein